MQRDTEVVFFFIQLVEPLDVAGSPQGGLGVLGQGEAPGGVRASNCGCRATLCQPLPAELPKTLQHLVTWLAAGTCTVPEQAVVDQGCDPIENVERAGGRSIAVSPPFRCTLGDDFGGFERQPTGEDREAAEQGPLGLIQEAIAPSNRVAHRLLPQWQVARTTAE